MSIEVDTQKDLALNAEDAENVVGGKMWSRTKKKLARKQKPTHAAAGAAVVVAGTPLSSSNQTAYSAEPVDAATQEAIDDC